MSKLPSHTVIFSENGVVGEFEDLVQNVESNLEHWEENNEEFNVVDRTLDYKFHGGVVYITLVVVYVTDEEVEEAHRQARAEVGGWDEDDD